VSVAMQWSRLTWPRQVDRDDLLAGLRQLVGSRISPVVLRAEASDGVVRHLVGAATPSAVEVASRPVPGLASSSTSGAEPVGNIETAVSLRFSTRRRAVALDDPERTVAGLLRALAQAGRGERLVLEWVLGVPLAPEAVPSRVEGAGPERWSTALAVAAWQAPRPMDPERRRALSAKRAEPGWRVLGRLGVQAATAGRRQMLLGGVLSALRAVESPALRLVVRSTSASRFGRPGVLGHTPAALNVPEVALLAAWPVGSTEVLPVQRVTSKRLPAHEGMPTVNAVGDQRVVAISNHAGSERALVLPPKEALRHLHVLGPTGSGKSVLLMQLIGADIASGRSCVVIDPKGDLVSDVLARVPAARRDDVVVLDPSGEEVIGLNPLADARDLELVADGLLDVLHQLFESSWGPRTNDIVHAGLLTLARAGRQSLVHLPLLLTLDGYRRRLTGNLDDPLGLEGFWAWYESISVEQRLTALGPVMNKLRTLLLRPGLRSVLGQSAPRFQLAEVFTRPRIVLVDLSRGRLGPEAAALFGALVVHQLWQGAQARVSVPTERRTPVMAYLDEFQDYLRLPLDLTEILTQARGLGLGLTLAHQHLGQLPTDVREAVLANAGSRVIFRLNAADAGVIARGGRHLEAEDVSGLGAFEVYADLLVADTPSGWMSGRAVPASPTTTDHRVVRRDSLRRWGVPRSQVETELRALLRDGTGQRTGVAGDAGTGNGAAQIGPRRRRSGGSS
jgi:hypothetical protein